MKKILVILFIVFLSNCQFFKKSPQLLFIQNAKSASFDGKILTIFQSDKNIIYFSDRPYRIAGKIKAQQFSKIWNSNKNNSFKKDNPNAAISFYQKNGEAGILTAKLSNFRNTESNVYYDMKILSGKMPKEVREIVIVIDDSSGFFNYGLPLQAHDFHIHTKQ